MKLLKTNFELPNEYQEDAIEDLRRHYRRLGIGNLNDIFQKFDWEVKKEGKTWTNLKFLGDTLNDDHTKLFQIVAPYVPEGCFIEMMGDNGVLWRWVFDGKTCKEVQPEIRWEEPSSSRVIKEENTTWLVGNDGLDHVLFAEDGGHYLHINLETSSENYPEVSISWSRKDEELLRQLIKEYYKGWSVQNNGLDLNLDGLDLTFEIILIST